jgi:hypothetical protein
MYLVLHDFLLCMKYDANMINLTNQEIPSSFGYMCCVKREQQIPISGIDYYYEGTCECRLKRKYLLGSNDYPPSRALDSSWLVTNGFCDAIRNLTESLISEHTDKRVTAAIQTCIYMNNANTVDCCLDESLAMLITKRDLRKRHVHPNNPVRHKKVDRKARLRAARHIPGKTKRPNYNFGNYSLVN